jgi:hypothetical protein
VVPAVAEAVRTQVTSAGEARAAAEEHAPQEAQR